MPQPNAVPPAPPPPPGMIIPGSSPYPPTSSDLARVAGIEAGCYVSFVIAVLFVVARIYARCCIVGTFGLDDFFLILATLMSVAITVCVPIMFRYGIGKHLVNVSMDDFLVGRMWAWISQIFYYAALGCVKCAIIALYHRLATQKQHKMLLKVIGAVVLGHGIAATITTAHMCDPVAIIWQPSFPIGCINILDFNYFNATFHILTDLMLAVIPIPILKGLQINRRKKIGLVIVFAVGALTILGTIARQVTNAIALNNMDFTWHWAPAELCTCIEVNMALICTSVPALRPLFKGLMKTTQGSSGDGSYELKKSRGGLFSFGSSSKMENGDSGYTARIFSSGSKKGGKAEKLTSTTDNGSEEHIVPQAGMVKNVDYTVEYSKA
ncbi:hypothetical protein K440DRAFT_662286 [Wilcoxina mikolae CBS 423.85]|nr:hypothetical protein K440DRAFT_662286 [Wilcoxina mikolae CBS 423.85]